MLLKRHGRALMIRMAPCASIERGRRNLLPQASFDLVQTSCANPLFACELHIVLYVDSHLQSCPSASSVVSLASRAKLPICQQCIIRRLTFLFSYFVGVTIRP
jgi:hypothetical protein